ncbi:MAG: diaminopimelate epimerase [Actinobacteria bacterium]|nr:diaminopimelate epimerase [Actinomycetota bacterium]
MGIRFVKMHGTGNDFVLLDGRDGLGSDVAGLAARLADRHFGVGCDQVLVVRAGATAPFTMEIWNGDGTRAEMCGNGIRCFAKWLYDHGEIAAGRVAIDTLGGPRWVAVQGYVDGAFRVSAGMGVPSFDPDALPMRPGDGRANEARIQVDGHALALTGVSMGNPHAVAFVDDVGAFPLESVGPLVERDATFPQRVNFEIVQVSGPRALNVRVWERGAGVTLACGTGAAAAVAASVASGRVAAGRVELSMPGGPLAVTWDGPGAEAVLHGPAVTVFDGTWPA